MTQDTPIWLHEDTVQQALNIQIWMQRLPDIPPRSVATWWGRAELKVTTDNRQL